MTFGIQVCHRKNEFQINSVYNLKKTSWKHLRVSLTTSKRRFEEVKEKINNARNPEVQILSMQFFMNDSRTIALLKSFCNLQMARAVFV